MQDRIYILSQDGAADRLIRAKSLTRAKAFAANAITGKLASQQELVDLTIEGVVRILRDECSRELDILVERAGWSWWLLQPYSPYRCTCQAGIVCEACRTWREPREGR